MIPARVEIFSPLGNDLQADTKALHRNHFLYFQGSALEMILMTFSLTSIHFKKPEWLDLSPTTWYPDCFDTNVYFEPLRCQYTGSLIQQRLYLIKVGFPQDTLRSNPTTHHSSAAAKDEVNQCRPLCVTVIVTLRPFLPSLPLA